MTSFLHDIPNYYGNRCEGCNEPRDLCECTKPVITLPTLADDPTPVVTMTDGALIVATVRIGSIVHRLMVDKGYRVVRS